jgi:hypothetical protein
MHRCRNCLDHGELLVLNDAGVCEPCAPIVGAKITAACEKVERAIVSMENAVFDYEVQLWWTAVEREWTFLSRWLDKPVARFGVNIERLMIVATEKRSAAFRRLFEREIEDAMRPCGTGNVKLEVGHLEVAARIARRFARMKGAEGLADRVKEVEAEVERQKSLIRLDAKKRSH